jgi:hypothetical protein
MLHGAGNAVATGRGHGKALCSCPTWNHGPQCTASVTQMTSVLTTQTLHGRGAHQRRG